VHEKIVNARRDFQHKLTTKVTRENQAVVIEDLNVSGMLKNHCLARSLADEGFGEIRRQLAYKGQWYGCRILVADRFFPSSKTCSKCSFVHSGLALRDRTFCCPSCGFTLDRDLNAAINLRTLSSSGNYVEQTSALRG
jgi:putative transposase